MNGIPAFGNTQKCFKETQWTIVVQSRAGSTEALEALCRTYWPPLYAFIRRKGFSREDAEDLAQSFFAYLLKRDALKDVSSVKGRFRNFLSAALDHFLCNEWAKRKTLKRGGKSSIISLQAIEEQEIAIASSESETPELLFDKGCAVASVVEAEKRLKERYLVIEQGRLIEALLPHLTSPLPEETLEKLAAEFHIKANTLKSKLRRLRQEFGDVIHEVVRETLVNPTQGSVREEVRNLSIMVE